MLTAEWQRISPRWGHPLHKMCPYLDASPARFAHYFIQKFTRPGDVVLDPFCGSGTIPLQACVEGRLGLGVDPNPLAVALTRAKIFAPDPVDLRNRLDDLSNDMFFADVAHEPRDVRALFHTDTLRQLVFLKQTLDPLDPCDAFLRGATLGLIQPGLLGARVAKRATCRRPPGFLQTAAAALPGDDAPGVETKDPPPQADVFALLRQRVDRLLRHGTPQTRGRAWAGRAQDLPDAGDPALRSRRVRLVLGAPPTLKNLRYGIYNWMRLWFLGEGDEALDRRADRCLRLDPWLAFMSDVCRQTYRAAAPNCVCALAIEDALGRNGAEPLVLAEELKRHLQRKRSRWTVDEILADENGGRCRRPKTRVLVMHRGDMQELRERVAW